MRSILEGLEFSAVQNPGKLLYAFLDVHGKIEQSYTYQEFLHRSDIIARHIQRVYPLKPGDRVLLAYPPGLEMICSFFACVRLGLIPVPVYPPSEHGFQSALYKMTFIARDCGAAAILTDRSYYWSMKLNLARTKISTFSFKTDYVSKLKWIISSDADERASESIRQAYSDILFLQYTSGSTNEPKGVMVTHENVFRNFKMVVDHVPVGVSWLPQYHDMGLIGYYLFFALKGGTTYGFSPKDFIQRPALWLEAISNFKGTASSAPNFAYSYCLKPGKIPDKTFENLDLSSLQFLMTAAEPVRTHTYQQFLKKFEPYGLKPESFFSAYGLAEYTLAVSNYGRKVKSFDSLSLQKNEVRISIPDQEEKSTSLISSGKPLGNTEIKIVDTSHVPKEVSEGSVGEIWISGPSKCKGYWNRPELSKEIFCAEGEGTLSSTSWLRSGDLGFMHEGDLYICARKKDLIIVRGHNYYPQDIENIVEHDSAIRKGCVAAFSIEIDSHETLVVVAEIKNIKEIPDPHLINKSIIQHLGIGVGLFVYISPRAMPKTSSGKIIRHQAKQLFLKNEFKIIVQVKPDTSSHLPISASNENGKLKELNGHDALTSLFKQYGLDIHESDTLPNLGFDSIKLAEFTHDIKKYVEVQGYDDLANTIEINLIQKIAISELYEILHALRSASAQSKLQFRQAFIRLHQSHMKMELEMMRQDVQPTVLVKRNGTTFLNGSSGGHIFLTGGSGFFGPFLLKSLLEQNSEEIYVLVRAEANDGMSRLRNAFSLIGVTEELQATFEKRVKPVYGNLSSPKLGVSHDQWEFLEKNIHTIYHNGAQVNYLFDYESMRDTNVRGTHEIVNLACTGRHKVLNHISTTFIFGWSSKETLFETDNNEDMNLLDFGYSQSKWVSEKIIMNAMKNGLDARIFRPALIAPSVSGGGYNFDISIRLLAFMLKHGVGTSAPNQVSFTPADVAANNIVAISNLKESLGLTFHVTRDDYSNMSDVTEIMSKFIGKEFQYFSLQDFVPEVVNRCTKEDLLFPLLNFLVHSVDNIKSMEFKRYDSSNYKSYRDKSAWGKQDPALEDVVLGILRFMDQQGIIEMLEKKKHYA